jgi:uncharacterized protein CbrC (UPF0167 family)
MDKPACLCKIFIMWPFKRKQPPPPKPPDTTFATLGAPFPLFDAPVRCAEDYVAAGKCSICGQQAQICFELGIGSNVICVCPKCEAENGLNAEKRQSKLCRNCKAEVPFPDVPKGKLLTCYSCLRAGRAAITKDTELGMVSWEQALEGMTHGRPRLNRPDFELVTTNSDWIRAKLPQAMMFELLRTPTYSTIQGDQWQFCCKQPMIYLGEWSREEFRKRTPDGDGEAYFRGIVKEIVPGLWEDKLHDETGVYVFLLLFLLLHHLSVFSSFCMFYL